MVQIALHTATADAVYDMMNQGLVDIGLFLEPINTEGLDYIRIMESDHWVVGMKPDDALADKEYITKRIFWINHSFFHGDRMCRASSQTGLERISISSMYLLSAILEQMLGLWRFMDWDIRFLLKVLQILERGFACSEKAVS